MNIFHDHDQFEKLLVAVQKKPTAKGHAELARAYNLRSYYGRAIEHAEAGIALDNREWDAWYELAHEEQVIYVGFFI